MSHQTDCPISESILRQKIIVIEDLNTFKTCNMNEPFVAQGIQSLIVLPIRQRSTQRAFGALNLLFSKSLNSNKKHYDNLKTSLI